MARGAMPMRGGWTMSMAWMRMGGSWPRSFAMFVAMWTLMMIAMMLPSLAPVMLRHRRPVRVAITYFAIWAAAGALIYPIGVACAQLEMRWPSRVPLIGGLMIALAGLAQLMRWKMRELDRCRDRSCCRPGRNSGPRQSLRDGVRLGVHCVSCCAPLIAILCVAGVMDPYAMVVVGAAITAERLARWPHRTARVIGVCAIAYGVASIVLARA